MKFWWTWKLKIFLSSFQKVQDHEHLMKGWGDMIKPLPSVLETSKGHIFWLITPNWVLLFAKFFSWHELSKSFITLHENSSHDHLLIQVNFGGKFINLKWMHHGKKWPLLICVWSVFKCIWSLVWYCSRMHASCTMQISSFGHNTLFSLISTKHD